jgi:Zn-dependent peptidase ImmA (M78 family)
MAKRKPTGFTPAGQQPQWVAIVARGSDGTVAILINRHLDPSERLAALTHELVHLERGGGCHTPGLPDRLRPLVTREERRVDHIAALRLVPEADLRAFVEARLSVGPVSAWDIADHFGVPLPVAILAGDELRRAG